MIVNAQPFIHSSNAFWHVKASDLERLEDWTAVLRLDHSQLSGVPGHYVIHKIQQLLRLLVCPLLECFTTV